MKNQAMTDEEIAAVLRQSREAMSALEEQKPVGLLRGLAHEVLDKMADDFRRPSFRAGFAVSMLSTAVLARQGARPLPAIVVSVMLGAAVERLYGMAEDIHGKLTGDAAGKV